MKSWNHAFDATDSPGTADVVHASAFALSGGRRRFRSWPVTAALMLALLSCGTGCQTWMKPPVFANPLTWFKGKSAEEKHGVPQRLVVLWADDVMGQTGKPSTRGFGGRLYFYNAEDKPIPVEGQLTIYAYDDTIPKKGAQRNPDRKFVFTAEQFQTHFSESQIGPSYSVWVPWEDIDGPRRDISLVPVFISSSGKVIMGPQTINVLAARTPEGEAKYNQLRMAQKTHHGPLAQVSHLEPAAGGSAGLPNSSGDSFVKPTDPTPERPTRVGLRTSTIPLNGSLSERLRTAPPTPPLGWNAMPAPASNTTPSNTTPSNTIPSNTIPSNTTPTNTAPGNSTWNSAGQGNAGPGNLGPGNAIPGSAGPSGMPQPSSLTPNGASLAYPGVGMPPAAGGISTTQAFRPTHRPLPPPNAPAGSGQPMENSPMNRLPPASPIR